MRGRKVAEQIHSAARNDRALGKQRSKSEGEWKNRAKVRQYSMQSESMGEERSPLRRPKYYLTPFSISN